MCTGNRAERMGNSGISPVLLDRQQAAAFLGRHVVRRESLSRQHQTVFGDGRGNCFATCVACLFGLPVAEVPNFCGDHTDATWWTALLDWLSPRGFTAIMVSFSAESVARMPALSPGLTVIAGGRGPRGFGHAVLMRDGELLHDPHPDGGGLAEVEDATIIVPLAWPSEESAKLRKARQQRDELYGKAYEADWLREQLSALEFIANLYVVKPTKDPSWTDVARFLGWPGWRRGGL